MRRAQELEADVALFPRNTHRSLSRDQRTTFVIAEGDLGNADIIEVGQGERRRCVAPGTDQCPSVSPAASDCASSGGVEPGMRHCISEGDAAGDSTAMVPPGGQRTELALDANDYRHSIHDPGPVRPRRGSTPPAAPFGTSRISGATPPG